MVDPDIGELTLDRMSGVAERFVRYAAAHGVATFTALPVEVCEGFVNAVTIHGTPPSSQTRHFRRTTIRVVLRTLRHAGVNAVDPTVTNNQVAMPGPSSLRPQSHHTQYNNLPGSLAPGSFFCRPSPLVRA